MTVTRKGSFRIDERMLKIKNAKRLLPLLLGNTAKNHFLKGFRIGGRRTDASRSGWAKRKRDFDIEKKGNKWVKRNNKGRAILVKDGDLRASIKVRNRNLNRLVVGTSGIRYAQIHNEGLRGKAFGKIPFKMPKREFIGNSKILERKLAVIIRRELFK